MVRLVRFLGCRQSQKKEKSSFCWLQNFFIIFMAKTQFAVQPFLGGNRMHESHFNQAFSIPIVSSLLSHFSFYIASANKKFFSFFFQAKKREEKKICSTTVSWMGMVRAELDRDEPPARISVTWLEPSPSSTSVQHLGLQMQSD